MSDRLLLQPDDQYNAQLVENVHPANWRNPKPAKRYNLVVVGAGTGGLIAALGAAGLGGKVALVERHLTGGDCLNVGCVPSKCLIASSRAIAHARDLERFGGRARDVEADFGAVMERMRRLRAGISANDAVQRLADAGVDVFLGEGVFTSDGNVQIGDATLRFARAVIATGARAVRPDVPGLEEAGYLTNETVFSLTELPKQIAVFGAGPIGCELAQVFQRLGAQVTVFERAGRLLFREDADAAEILERSMARDGVDVKCRAEVFRIEMSPDGKVIHFRNDAGDERVVVDEILVGAGRAPNVEGIGLERVGVEYDLRAGVTVDDRLRTTNRRLYAVGDCCMRAKFTHMADAAARLVIANSLFFGRGRLSGIVVPWCTYTDPEIAHTGMYEHDAHERGIEVETFVQKFDEVDRAIADGETEGFVKVHVKVGTDRILGATICARHAGDMISELTTAIVCGIGLKQLPGVVHPYPTQAEAIRKVANQYNHTRLTPRTAALLKRILSWRR